MAKPNEIEKKWYLVDAAGQTLGRFATEIAQILTGKNKVEYTPHVDTGDFVIVINAEKIRLTGDKWKQKKYYHHSQFPGGLKEVSYEELKKRRPELIIEHAVKGMIPKNKLGDKMLKKLKVYAGPEHPHEAQDPEDLEL
jgi:large subunit ribosomal protein L13